MAVNFCADDCIVVVDVSELSGMRSGRTVEDVPASVVAELCEYAERGL